MEKKENEQACLHCGYDQDELPASFLHLPPGTILQNKYLLGKALGQGGFGITYIAFDLKLELKLAIKEFFPQGLAHRSHGNDRVLTNSDKDSSSYRYGLDRFLYEAKTLARFSEHPNIVNVRDYFEANNTAYMVMNYVSGITLDDYLKRKGGKISFKHAMDIMLPVFDVLNDIHQKGLLHRDISPDNIYLTKSGRVKLIDFGAARQALQNQSHSISVIMKAGYSPVEQYQSKGKQGPWTDIYAAAATMYRSITGIMPPSALDRIIEDTLVLPSDYGVKMNQSQEKALLKALSVKSEDRYQSVSEFQEKISYKPEQQKDFNEQLEERSDLLSPDDLTNTQKVLKPEGRATGSRTYAPKFVNIRTISALFLISFAVIVLIASVNSRDHSLDEIGGNGAGVEDTDLDSVEEPLETVQPDSFQAADGLAGVQTIGGLFPLSGPLSLFGENSAAAAKLAVKDVNQWLDEENIGWQLNLEISDTKTEGPEALKRMQQQHEQGVHFFVGPQGSGVVYECLDYANANQILFISQSSTFPGLAIEDDWFFRFVTDDSVQAPVIADIAKEANLEYMIYIWQGDTWADWLQSKVAANMSEGGIVNFGEVRFDPGRKDFHYDVSMLNRYVRELNEQGVPSDKIGINIITFEQAANILSLAEGYPRLSEVAWIGSDGTAASEAIITDSVAAEFASKVTFINPMHRAPQVGTFSNRDRVREHIQIELGREPDSYSYITYDIVWTLALSINHKGYDSNAVKEVLPNIAESWSKDYGASGHIVLNKYGDRAYSDFDFWVINENLSWDIIGMYDGERGKIIW